MTVYIRSRARAAQVGEIAEPTCKPNSVPVRGPEAENKRRPFIWAAHYCAALATYPETSLPNIKSRLRSDNQKDWSGPLSISFPYLALHRRGLA